jgi:hypothetical protein
MAPVKITLAFLGIDLDTEKQEARLPDEKLEKCFNLVEAFLHRKNVTLEEIHSLCGLLNIACQVIHTGQAFLRRLFKLTRELERPNRRVKLKRGCKDDLKVWWEFKKNFSGKCFFLDEKFLNSDRVNLYTDASGVHG